MQLSCAHNDTGHQHCITMSVYGHVIVMCTQVQVYSYYIHVNVNISHWGELMWQSCDSHVTCGELLWVCIWPTGDECPDQLGGSRKCGSFSHVCERKRETDGGRDKKKVGEIKEQKEKRRKRATRRVGIREKSDKKRNHLFLAPLLADSLSLTHTLLVRQPWTSPGGTQKGVLPRCAHSGWSGAPGTFQSVTSCHWSLSGHCRRIPLEGWPTCAWDVRR